MLEKLLLASILTFSFSVVSEMNWSVSSQKIHEVTPNNQSAVTVAQRQQNIKINKQ